MLLAQIRSTVLHRIPYSMVWNISIFQKKTQWFYIFNTVLSKKLLFKFLQYTLVNSRGNWAWSDNYFSYMLTLNNNVFLNKHYALLSKLNTRFLYMADIKKNSWHTNANYGSNMSIPGRVNFFSLNNNIYCLNSYFYQNLSKLKKIKSQQLISPLKKKKIKFSRYTPASGGVSLLKLDNTYSFKSVQVFEKYKKINNNFSNWDINIYKSFIITTFMSNPAFKYIFFSPFTASWLNYFYTRKTTSTAYSVHYSYRVEYFYKNLYESSDFLFFEEQNLHMYEFTNSKIFLLSQLLNSEALKNWFFSFDTSVIEEPTNDFFFNVYIRDIVELDFEFTGDDSFVEVSDVVTFNQNEYKFISSRQNTLVFNYNTNKVNDVETLFTIGDNSDIFVGSSEALLQNYKKSKTLSGLGVNFKTFFFFCNMQHSDKYLKEIDELITIFEEAVIGDLLFYFLHTNVKLLNEKFLYELLTVTTDYRLFVAISTKSHHLVLDALKIFIQNLKNNNKLVVFNNLNDEVNVSIYMDQVNVNDEQVNVNDEQVNVNDEQVNVNDEQVNVNDEQVNVNDEQVNVNDEQVNVNDEQVNVNDEQVNVNDEQVNVNDEQVNVNDEQVNVNDEQVNVNDEQVTVNDEQVTVNDEQVTVNDEQVNVNDEQVSVNDEQVSVDDEQVSVDDEQVNVNDEQVNVDDEQVNVDDEQVNVDEGQNYQLFKELWIHRLVYKDFENKIIKNSKKYIYKKN